MLDVFSFSGRTGRLTYWALHLVSAVILIGIVMAFPKSDSALSEISMVALTASIFGVLVALWMNIAATVRRFHDRNKSGFWYFALLIPFIGLWFAIELAFFRGVDDSNQFG